MTMPKSKNVQYTNKENLIKERCGNDFQLFLYFSRHISQGIAEVRKLCALQPEDWAFYEECKAYELLENRDEEDRIDEPHVEKNLNCGRKGRWYLLAEPLFNQLKDESDSKKLTWKIYFNLRLKDLSYEKERLTEN
jgi:hypothetical protein